MRRRRTTFASGSFRRACQSVDSARQCVCSLALWSALHPAVTGHGPSRKGEGCGREEIPSSARIQQGCRRRRSVCQTQTCAAMSFFRSPMVSSALHLTRTCARVSKRSRSARIRQAREGYIYLLSEPVVAHHLNHCALHLVSFLQPPLRPCLFRRGGKRKNIAGRGNPFLPPSLHLHCRENNVHAWATLSNPPLRDILIRTLVLPNRIRSNVWW